MRLLFLLIGCVLSTTLFSFNLSRHNQMLIVIVDDWGCSHGKLWRFEKEGSSQWQCENDSIEVRLGGKGLAWGRGLHPQKKLVGPKKNEADDHSPAGIFPIGPIFGFQPKEDINNLKMPYIHVTPSIVVVDDINSSFYNQILDSTLVSGNWNSSLHLKDCSFLKWGAIIEHNCHPSISKDGSCIFLCVDNDDIEPMRMTSTCLQEENLLDILYWLRQVDNPIIVQLTKQNYLKFKERWHLPDIEWKK